MIITICGSLKFKQEMMKVAEKMTFAGHCVLTPLFIENSDIQPTPEQMQKLKQSHFCKIDLSDAILVVNVDNYIGESTRSEIEYATQKGKKVLYYTLLPADLMQ